MQHEYKDERLRFATRAIKGFVLGIAGWALLIWLGWYVIRAFSISWHGVAITGALIFVVGAIRWLRG